MSFVVMLCFATFVYYCERGTFKVKEDTPDGAYYRRTSDGKGEEITPFTNIMVAWWWVIVNTTPLKHGMVPSSIPAKIMAVVLSYLGILLLALPISVIGRSFIR
jgi:hypothetical protein